MQFSPRNRNLKRRNDVNTKTMGIAAPPEIVAAMSSADQLRFNPCKTRYSTPLASPSTSILERVNDSPQPGSPSATNLNAPPNPWRSTRGRGAHLTDGDKIDRLEPCASHLNGEQERGGVADDVGLDEGQTEVHDGLCSYC